MLGTSPVRPVEAPPLPQPRGPLSAAVIDALRRGPTLLPPVDGADPHGDDLQLALYCLYEMHYRGFGGVPDDREWDPALVALRVAAENAFLDALRAEADPSDDVDAEIGALLVEPVEGTGPSWHLAKDGERWQVREYVAQRSLYHLKEADPQAWVIARLDGPAKAALVTVEHDEYGAGNPDRMHARLFADMMRALDLDDSYGAYLDAAPAEALAEVNFMSLCGLRRALRGALVGQFATVELTSSPGSDRLVKAMRRLDLPEAAVEFYAEHVEADAVHEQLVRRGVIAPLLAAEPALAADVVFGIRASGLLADRFGERLLRHWAEHRSSLRHPLPDAPQPDATQPDATQPDAAQPDATQPALA
ncbi:MAG TPA: iron-containing redox enzyme family protein [Pseudonocardia sp.]|uniref:iron-containing redox enzyme family protein n=1 Tax=Pseudonocardia sp. TaxID=60912 RepID=UPI002B4AD334|nr:iron-containing redox enzyme family protein [Pseudonocardia sp.]HLU60470.1 iron-containing redox enzyme family protein [Pseudonocardia sp.]